MGGGGVEEDWGEGGREGVGAKLKPYVLCAVELFMCRPSHIRDPKTVGFLEGRVGVGWWWWW